ncbi:Thiamine-binding protein [Robiginitalea myxolifaciens]|uniref:Thiamine-binding protein n=1 Tax=Robiginitalea myxolifaciens TaxID=400055 RepID=A0A1I6G7W2_9FLAO|nr:thiamine-binding protein [Robiginitalea myxolifaciens]SFR38282.1 Thiamine-binding protein [Robiginitalea myxolifaciens]
MNISVELTYSPLRDTYENEIIRFIKALRASGLKVLENPMSTQIYGPYDRVMDVLNREMKASLEAVDQGVFFLKMVKTDRSDYEPHF